MLQSYFSKPDLKFWNLNFKDAHIFELYIGLWTHDYMNVAHMKKSPLLKNVAWISEQIKTLPSCWRHVLASHFESRAGTWCCRFALQISDASGMMKVSSVAPSSPFKQAMLSPEECYILDNGVDKNIFVWKGANFSDSIAQFKKTDVGSDPQRCFLLRKIMNVLVETHVVVPSSMFLSLSEVRCGCPMLKKKGFM